MVAGHLQQKKGHWYIVLNMHDEMGKRRSKWIATHLPVQGNKRRAEEMLLQARQQHTDLYHGTNPNRLLFSDYMLQWLAGMDGKVSPTTYRGYRSVIENCICPYFRERQISLAGLRAADLEAYYTYLQKQGTSPNTAIHHHANIHKALKDAVRLDLITRNVAEIAERPQKQKYLPAHYSAEEVNLLLDKLRGHWMFVPVTLSVFYGLRRGEVLGLQWRSVDLENKTIAIQHTRVLGEVNGRDVAIGRDVLKRKSSYRTLPVPDAVHAMLHGLKVSRYGENSVPANDYICLNREGKPIAPNYLTQCFKRFLRDNGLREIRLHDLRHPYVKHTTKNISLQKQKSQTTNRFDSLGFLLSLLAFSLWFFETSFITI